MTSILRLNLLLIGLAGLAFPQTPAPGPGEFGAPRLLIPAPKDPDLQHLGWPKVLRKGKKLYVFCLAGQAHTRKGSPVMFVSGDGGKTFAGPTVLMKFGEGGWQHSGNLAAGLARDGALVVLAMAMNAGSSRTAIFGWRSSDGGGTWQPSDTSALSGKAGSVYGHVFPVPGKGLAVTGHFRKGATAGEQGVWIAYSKDDGRRWGTAQPVTGGPHVEPSIVYTAARFVGLIRTRSMDRYVQVVSEDAGNSWRQSDALTTAGAVMPSPFIGCDPRDAERLWALQSDRNPKGLGDGKGKIWLWSARLDALEWKRAGLLATFPSRTSYPEGDFSYPWMTPLGGRDWFVVFYFGTRNGPNSIWGMKIRVPR